MEDYHKCPLDWRTENKLNGNGCFYTCKIFQKKYKIPKHEIINLYKKQIKYAEALLKDKPNPNSIINRAVDQCFVCIHLDEENYNFKCMRNQITNTTSPCDQFRRK